MSSDQRSHDFLQNANLKNLTPSQLAFHEKSLEVSLNRRKICLTRKEFRILVELHSGIGRVCSREELLLTVWGKNVFVDSRTIDRHVVRLRRKLKDLNEPSLSIDTVWGIGYRLRAPGFMQE